MNVVAFVISFGLFLTGLWLFGEAFNIGDAGFWVFSAGLVLTSVAIFIPFQILGISKKHD